MTTPAVSTLTLITMLTHNNSYDSPNDEHTVHCPLLFK